MAFYRQIYDEVTWVQSVLETNIRSDHKAYIDLPDVINCQLRELRQHFCDPCIFCHRTNSLEFTA